MPMANDNHRGNDNQRQQLTRAGSIRGSRQRSETANDSASARHHHHCESKGSNAGTTRQHRQEVVKQFGQIHKFKMNIGGDNKDTNTQIAYTSETKYYYTDGEVAILDMILGKSNTLKSSAPTTAMMLMGEVSN